MAERSKRTERLAGALGRWVESLGIDVNSIDVDAPPAAALPACEMCGDLGALTYNVPYDHHLFGKTKACPYCEAGQARTQRQWDSWLASAKLPAKFREYSFETFANLGKGTDGKLLAYDACWQWSNTLKIDINSALAAAGRHDLMIDDSVRHSVVLWGSYGTGKTGLAAASVRVLREKGVAVLYTRAQDLFAEIQARYGGEGDGNPQQILDEYKTAAALIIDDCNVGSGEATRDKREKLEAVIRYRHGQALPTLVTTNLDQHGFAAMWGERTEDVLSEMAHWIKVSGNKLRQVSRGFED